MIAGNNVNVKYKITVQLYSALVRIHGNQAWCSPFTLITRVEVFCVGKLIRASVWSKNKGGGGGRPPGPSPGSVTADKTEIWRGGRTDKQNRLWEKKNGIASGQSPRFLKLLKRNGAIHLIFQPEFPVVPCKWEVLYPKFRTSAPPKQLWVGKWLSWKYCTIFQ